MGAHQGTRRGLVDLMIVGAQKAGTSTLLDYLSAHPVIEGQAPPEMTWFTDPPTATHDRHQLEQRYFPGSDGRSARAGKLAGLMYDDHAVERLRATDPQAQVVALLREPVSRAYSAFWHARARGREPLERFEDALVGDPARFADDDSRRICAYVERGDYATAIERLLGRFPRESVHVVFLEDLLEHPQPAVAPILVPLGLRAEDLPAHVPAANAARAERTAGAGRAARQPTLRRLARGLPPGARERLRRRGRQVTEVARRPPPIDPTVAAHLREQYVEPNRRLAALLGRDLPAGW